MRGGEYLDEIVCMGKVFRTLRRARSLSQIDIAYQAHLNLSYYSRIERGEGNPTIKTVMKILDTLDIQSEEYWGMVALEKQNYSNDPRPHELKDPA